MSTSGHLPRRVAIIGAGISGILTIKALKEEEHLFSEIICYERTSHPGGLWMYREFEDGDNEYDVNKNICQVPRVKSDVTTVMKGTIANSSKEMSAFSDFPPSATTPNFMHHREMLKYIISYGKQFDCLKHIKLNCEVKNVTKVTANKMSITIQDYSNGARNNVTVNEVFDLVIVASGHHGRPYLPTFPGQDNFKGEIMHTHSYKRPDKFVDKKVCIVGVGNSGLDVAVEVSNVADEVYLSTRSGCWVLPRLGFRGGRPFDTNSLTRFMHFFKENFHPSVVSFVIETFLNRRFDHELFGLRPAHPLFHEHPTVNDQIATKILCGMVKVKGDIDSITKSGVIFKQSKVTQQLNQLKSNQSNGHVNGKIDSVNSPSNVTQVDSIILATGYHLDYPFLCPALKSQIVTESSVNLYKYVFPIFEDESDTDDQVSAVNLAFIGVPNALGPLFPVAEIQSRWLVQVIKGTCKLPDKRSMRRHLDVQIAERKRKFTDRLRHGVQVEWIPYLDEIASEFGAKVDMSELFRKDFKLWAKLYFGPSVPYQYRLTGPHSWPGARDAILGVRERMEAPLKCSLRTNESTSGLDQMSINPRYWDHAIIYTLFYGVIVVTLLDLMNLFY